MLFTEIDRYSVKMEIRTPQIYCLYPTFTGSIIPRMNRSDVRLFKGFGERVTVKGFQTYIHYEMKVYMTCVKAVFYYNYTHYFGPGGMQYLDGSSTYLHVSMILICDIVIITCCTIP